jgi:oligoribonuclease
MPYTAPDRSTNLIWIDLEMTGLDTQADTIIEIATVVTDKFLSEIAQGPVVAIHQPTAVMDAMDEWNTRHHGRSGLTARVLASEQTANDAEKATLEFLSEWVDRGASPMCGNSICQDRRFLAREMHQLENYFHYRNLDVSTLKILGTLWAPEVIKGYEKDSQHLALADIRDSIEELNFYREHLFDADVLGGQDVDD